jgi:hypothetical protein
MQIKTPCVLTNWTKSWCEKYSLEARAVSYVRLSPKSRYALRPRLKMKKISMSVCTLRVGNRKTRASKTGRVKVVEDAHGATHGIFNIGVGSQMVIQRLIQSHKVSSTLVYNVLSVYYSIISPLCQESS